MLKHLMKHKYFAKIVIAVCLSDIKSYEPKFIGTLLAVLVKGLWKVRLFCFKFNEASIELLL